MSARNRRFFIGNSVVLLCTLSACEVGPDFGLPVAPPVTHYANGADPVETASAGGAVQHFTPGAKVDADWWRLFKSPKLNDASRTWAKFLMVSSSGFIDGDDISQVPRAHTSPATPRHAVS